MGKNQGQNWHRSEAAKLGKEESNEAMTMTIAHTCPEFGFLSLTLSLLKSPDKICNLSICSVFHTDICMEDNLQLLSTVSSNGRNVYCGSKASSLTDDDPCGSQQDSKFYNFCLVFLWRGGGRLENYTWKPVKEDARIKAVFVTLIRSTCTDAVCPLEFLCLSVCRMDLICYASLQNSLAQSFDGTDMSRIEASECCSDLEPISACVPEYLRAAS